MQIEQKHKARGNNIIAKLKFLILWIIPVVTFLILIPTFLYQHAQNDELIKQQQGNKIKIENSFRKIFSFSTNNNKIYSSDETLTYLKETSNILESEMSNPELVGQVDCYEKWKKFYKSVNSNVKNWGEKAVFVSISEGNYQAKPEGPYIIVMTDNPATSYGFVGSSTPQIIKEYYSHYFDNLECLQSKNLYIP